jgi:hypothetical protein
MRKQHVQSHVLAALAAGSALVVAPQARASNPLEYPDNGSASFSRGGAWLGTANEPIAAHYNPAALAAQGSGFSIEQNMAFDKVCYDRVDANGKAETASDGLEYRPACNTRNGFPGTVPSISLAWRVSRKLGIGIAIVPPSTYVLGDHSLPATKLGFSTNSNQYQQVPAPYRYQLLEQQSTIIFPTLGIGYEVFPKFRVGAAFISGIAVINTTVAGIALESVGTLADHARDDGLTTLKTKDLFVPGAILSIHWSPLPVLDVALWGRWIDDVYSTHGEITLTSQAYNPDRVKETGAPAFSQLQPICRQDPATCGANPHLRVPNTAGNEAFRQFRFPFPPEVRAGVRFHLPRTQAGAAAGAMTLVDHGEKRDPLHDDVFDIELDGSYSLNSAANTIEIRFADSAGKGLTPIKPIGYIPPNADRWNGYKDSVGIRLGGQYNVLRDRLGLRAGTWFETQSQKPEWLQVGVVGATRGGFGGGIVLRQDFIDISIGYQHQWSLGLDNHGNGLMRTTITSSTPEPNLSQCVGGATASCEPAGVSAADRTQFRSAHVVNDGRVTQSAEVFTLGGTVRF